MDRRAKFEAEFVYCGYQWFWEREFLESYGFVLCCGFCCRLSFFCFCNFINGSFCFASCRDNCFFSDRFFSSRCFADGFLIRYFSSFFNYLFSGGVATIVSAFFRGFCSRLCIGLVAGFALAVAIGFVCRIAYLLGLGFRSGFFYSSFNCLVLLFCRLFCRLFRRLGSCFGCGVFCRAFRCSFSLALSKS